MGHAKTGAIVCVCQDFMALRANLVTQLIKKIRRFKIEIHLLIKKKVQLQIHRHL